MSELEPLSEASREVLSLAEVPEPPEGAELRVLGRLKAVLPPVLAPQTTPMAPALGRWGAPAAIAGLVVGVLVGASLQRTLGEPRVERQIVEVKVPSASVVEAPRPEPEPAVPEAAPAPPPAARRAPAPAPTPPPVKESMTDVALARERQLIEQARSALVRGALPAARETLDEHRSAFPGGRLAEERESLAIQASIRAGDFARARADAQAFRERFPESLLLPAVEAALSSIPP